MMRLARPVGVAVLGAAGAACLAGGPGGASGGASGGGWRAFRDPTVQDYGFDWANVGQARNADWVGLDPGFQVISVGGVNHRYRISTTEVTHSQWIEFVRAYGPFVDPNSAGSTTFTSQGIARVGSQYLLISGWENRPVNVGWRFAARYLNWLNNSQALTQDAFESGVYDTSTFGSYELPNGIDVITDQAARSPGARYFIPTLDEWIKAVHFDPDRHGEDMPGYWLYPDGGDQPLVQAPPPPEGDGETNAGDWVPSQGSPFEDVMSYPHVSSPWGLFDASGGAAEWMETLKFTSGNPTGRVVELSNIGTQSAHLLDRINWFGARQVTNTTGLRIASVVPTPTSVVVALLSITLTGMQRRHRT